LIAAEGESRWISLLDQRIAHPGFVATVKLKFGAIFALAVIGLSLAANLDFAFDASLCAFLLKEEQPEKKQRTNITSLHIEAQNQV